MARKINKAAETNADTEIKGIDGVEDGRLAPSTIPMPEDETATNKDAPEMTDATATTEIVANTDEANTGTTEITGVVVEGDASATVEQAPAEPVLTGLEISVQATLKVMEWDKLLAFEKHLPLIKAIRLAEETEKAAAREQHKKDREEYWNDFYNGHKAECEKRGRPVKSFDEFLIFNATGTDEEADIALLLPDYKKQAPAEKKEADTGNDSRPKDKKPENGVTYILEGGVKYRREAGQKGPISKVWWDTISKGYTPTQLLEDHSPFRKKDAETASAE